MSNQTNIFKRSTAVHFNPHIGRHLACVALIAGLLVTGHSSAAPRDESATSKSDETMNGYFATGDLAQAEAHLLGIDVACQDQCSFAIKARLWSYIGIVRCRTGSNGAGAREAFERAVDLDPQIILNAAYSNSTIV